MTRKKYELLTDLPQYTVQGFILYPIRALRDIPFYGIKTGDLGGAIASEQCLSHKGDCWVYGRANVVSGRVTEQARVMDFAFIDGGQISGYAQVSGSASTRGSPIITNDAVVSGEARISGNAKVFDNAIIYGNAQISGNAKAYGYAHICEQARIDDHAWVFGDATLAGGAHLTGKVRFSAAMTIIRNKTYSGSLQIDDRYAKRLLDRLTSKNITAYQNELQWPNGSIF